MIYNRRRKREYFAEQKALTESLVQDASVALRSGTATAEQLKLLEQQRGQAAVAAEMRAKVEELREARASAAAPAKEVEEVKKGIVAQATGWLFKGLKSEDRPEVGYGNVAEEREERGGVVRAVEARRAEEQERQGGGGPLDRLGREEEKEEGKGGWTSFMTRK